MMNECERGTGLAVPKFQIKVLVVGESNAGWEPGFHATINRSCFANP
jgi:hypothetical protein